MFAPPTGGTSAERNCPEILFGVSNFLHRDQVLNSLALFNRALCRKAPIVGANLKGAVRASTENGGKIAENRALTDVNRRYVGIYDRFSAVTVEFTTITY